jgi:outer membrane lipoprotein SlyB
MTDLQRRGAIGGAVIGGLASASLGIAVGGRKRFLVLCAVGALIGSYVGQRVATRIGLPPV